MFRLFAPIAALVLAACASAPPPDGPGLYLRGVDLRSATPQPDFERAFRRALNARANTPATREGRPIDLIVTVEALSDAALLAEQLGADSQAQIHIALRDPETEDVILSERRRAEEGAVTIIGPGLINPMAGLAAAGFSLLANMLSDETDGLATALADAVVEEALVPNAIALPRHHAFHLPPARNPDQRRPGEKTELWLGRYRSEAAARAAISDILRFNPDIATIGWFEIRYEERRHALSLFGLTPVQERGLCARRRADGAVCVLAPGTEGGSS